MDSINNIKIGEEAEILKVMLKGDRKIRFNEMGITEGAFVKVVNKAPLNDPIEIKIRGYKICIRRNDAKHVLVKKINVDVIKDIAETGSNIKINVDENVNENIDVSMNENVNENIDVSINESLN